MSSPEIGSQVEKSDSTRTGEQAPFLLWASLAAATVAVRLLATGGLAALPRWDALSRWDSLAYLRAADRAVDEAAAGVLPVYPALVRALTWVTGDRLTTAVLVSYGAGAAAAWLAWIWLGQRGHDRAQKLLGLGILLAFPFSFVLYGVVGPESLCLALSLAALVLAERRRFLKAALFAAVAVATQLAAVALLPALTVLAYQHFRSGGAPGSQEGRVGATPESRSNGPPAVGVALVLGIGIPTLGFVAAAVHSHLTFEDAWAPWRSTAQLSGLSLGPLHPASWLRVGWITEEAPWTWLASRGIQAAILYGALGGSYFVWKRYGVAYAALTVGVVLAALVNVVEANGMGRRLLILVPFAGLVAEWLAGRPKWLGWSIVGVMGACMLWVYGLYVRGMGLPNW